jgi:hypothetical protein
MFDGTTIIDDVAILKSRLNSVLPEMSEQIFEFFKPQMHPKYNSILQTQNVGGIRLP